MLIPSVEVEDVSQSRSVAVKSVVSGRSPLALLSSRELVLTHATLLIIHYFSSAAVS